MDNEFYKVVKLKTGETILCTMSSDVKNMSAEPYIKMTVPVLVIPHQETRKGANIVGESFILRPWMGLSNSEEFVIGTDIVLTIGDLKKEVKEHYIGYITQIEETKKRIEIQQEISDAVDIFLKDIGYTSIKYEDDDDN